LKAIAPLLAKYPTLQIGRVLKGIVLQRMVGRCRLPVSKAELKARLVSALETEM
jgi:hypothetical protein